MIAVQTARCVARAGVTQHLFGGDERREPVAHVVHHVLAYRPVDVRLIVFAALTHRHHPASVTLPFGLDRANLGEALSLPRIVREQVTQMIERRFERWESAFVPLQENRIPGDEIAAHTRLHVDHELLRFVRFGNHSVGVLDPARGREQPADLPQQHSCDDRHQQQRQHHGARQIALEFFLVHLIPLNSFEF
ncbi:MAG: hypothetical protein M3458_05390 [Acidobacteriota bacterium]|nr:hypothetical protein [Acidobacteriota bacterium]